MVGYGTLFIGRGMGVCDGQGGREMMILEGGRKPGVWMMGECYFEIRWAGTWPALSLMRLELGGCFIYGCLV